MPTKKDTSFMFINTLHYNENTIKHELIHYFQDNNGISILDNILPIDILNTYGLCENINPTDLFKPEEYVPYANKICYVFEKNGVTTTEQARDIIFKFFDHIFFSDDDKKKYIKKCQALPEYQWFSAIRKQDYIEYYMLCNIYNYKNAETMRWIIENYFKKDE